MCNNGPKRKGLNAITDYHRNYYLFRREQLKRSRSTILEPVLPHSTRHTTSEALDAVRRLSREAAALAHVPYSGRHEAALIVLSDGRYIPGARVESASFSLTIPALLNAATTAIGGGRTDIVAVVLSRPINSDEHAALHEAPFDGLEKAAPDCYTVPGLSLSPSTRWDPTLSTEAPAKPIEGIAQARIAAERAHVPESDFPVGCVIETVDGTLLPGVNVENPNWSRVLCAERNALGTLVSYGFGRPRAMYLACLRDHRCTPCGACRQLISELAPQCTLWMDRGEDPPDSSEPHALLPGFFTGASIPRNA